jgi:hypothetical protein
MVGISTAYIGQRPFAVAGTFRAEKRARTISKPINYCAWLNNDWQRGWRKTVVRRPNDVAG